MSPENNAQFKFLEAELVVIGTGGAGIVAALAAAEKGIKNIVVLEKKGTLGGNTMRAGQIFACESPAQRQAGFIADKDEYFKIAMKWAHWERVDPKIVRAFINKSGDTIRWLQEKGIEFKLEPFYPGQLRVGHSPSMGGGYQLVTTLAKKCEELGVKVLLHTTANLIVRDAKGNIAGVGAVEEGGMEIRMKTKSVIIATGGFGGNKELLKKYCLAYYDDMRCSGLPHTGDGLILAEKAGAAIADTIPMLKEGPNPDCPETAVLKLMCKDSNTVWVNKLGRRFIDENAGFKVHESGNAILQQPGRVMFTIFDSKRIQDMGGYLLSKAPPRKETPNAEKGPPTPNSGMVKINLVEALQAQEKSGAVKIADSWEEIAKWIGVDPKVLKATIDEYNSYCDHGYDKEYAKDRKYLQPLLRPPFYCLRGATTFLDTLGGIIVNEHMEVKDKQDHIIPGLYAAGVIADGFEGETYCIELCGSAFGFSVNSGRIAAESAAEYVLGK